MLRKRLLLRKPTTGRRVARGGFPCTLLTIDVVACPLALFWNCATRIVAGLLRALRLIALVLCPGRPIRQ